MDAFERIYRRTILRLNREREFAFFDIPTGKRTMTDILSAKLGFEILVQKIRELESAVKDTSWNSRKRISILEAENAELWRRLEEEEECKKLQFLKFTILGAERDELHRSLRLLDAITDGREDPTGGEPEWICQIVERWVELRRKLDEPCPVCVEQEEALKRVKFESQEQVDD